MSSQSLVIQLFERIWPVSEIPTATLIKEWKMAFLVTVISNMYKVG